ncbi:M56 family metallopeptidase [Parafrigoribacterium mesophilum]|uniref:M56 family metallopeptidase n=1 Tax=Parafrigoribacterium mesophilum TaxID=433646 RepID=UPI0031FD8B92
MRVALLLLGYAIVLAAVVAPLLRRASWVERAPRLAIAAWQALTVTVLASVTMAGAAVTIPLPQISGDVAALLRACVMALREQYASPGGVAVGATGAVLALAVIGRTLWSLAAGTLRMVRERTRHRRVLDVVGRRVGDMVVLDCEESAVYCLPGRRRRTVVTTAALRSLDDGQLEAVLAHERAHLRERHDLAITLSSALAAAFPAVRLFRVAASETARLVELRADDAAAARTDRLTVAGALLSIVTGATPHPVPSSAMAAAGSGTAARVRRLLPPQHPLGRIRSLLTSVAVVALLALPVFVLGGPAAAATQQNLCPHTESPAYSASR